MKDKNAWVVIAAAVVLVAFFAGYSLNPKTQIQVSLPTPEPTFEPSATPTPFAENSFLVEEGFTKTISIDLPAVDKNNLGVLAKLNIEARNGNGKIYIDYSSGAPLLASDTQNSFLNAVDLAKEITGKTIEETNLYYSLSTDAQEVGGGSAGAATAVATAVLLSGKSIRKWYIITGSADRNGKIGKVGRIMEKAQAAKNAGYKVMLVPKGEAAVVVGKEKCVETSQGNAYSRVCNTVYEEENVEEAVGIGIVEVETVQDAFGIMSG